ncbi:MAG TPA: mechanosensitive ion channel domain-containing protein [Lacunisphaera sp.]|jgi:small-conductance mechanosensitive channel|nr:mechanosensitive ion channel domain-containing protein [Lacunisphaera sp.]
MKTHLPALSDLLPVLLAGIPTVVAVVAGAVVINLVLSRGLTLLTRHASFTEHEIGPVRRAIKWLITLGAVVFALGAFGVNVSGIWGVLSTILAMVAIGFVAVWSVLSNTLCTLMIMIFRPFSIGDELEFAGEPVKGRVTDLNFVYTTLDVGDGSVLQVPNNLFFQKTLRRRHAAVDATSPARHLREKPPTPAEAPVAAAAPARS